MLLIDNLTVDYGRVPALRGLTLEVREGEIVSPIGPNGAGKTTTLKATFGLVPPRAGAISYNGTPLIGKAPEDIARLGLSLVPEGRHIFSTLSVRENLALGRRTRHGDDTILDGVLDIFPALRRYLKQPAGGLSGGEQQQLAIARALIARPRLLLLDEPSLGLAPIVVSQVFSVVADLREQGVTVLLVEQNATRAMQLADRSYVLRSGALVMEGTRKELEGRADLHDAYLGQAPASS